MHGDLIHAPPQELQPIISPWPFFKWEIDLIGKIHANPTNGHKFIITSTNYFRKWIEAIPMTYITDTKISKFILSYIICRYEVPLVIVTDNGHPFKNQDVRVLYEKLHI